MHHTVGRADIEADIETDIKAYLEAEADHQASDLGEHHQQRHAGALDHNVIAHPGAADVTARTCSRAFGLPHTRQHRSSRRK